MGANVEQPHDACHDDDASGLSKSSILLTGGASRRMGIDKADLLVNGEPLGHRLAHKLRSAGWEPTVLGRAPIQDYQFFPDKDMFAGPLAALRAFSPASELVFVLSCDVPLFDGSVCAILNRAISHCDAVIPMISGKLQPLCALYRFSAWTSLTQLRSERVMDWITHLNARVLDDLALTTLGIHPEWCASANTPSELAKLLKNQTSPNF